MRKSSLEASNHWTMTPKAKIDVRQYLVVCETALSIALFTNLDVLITHFGMFSFQISFFPLSSPSIRFVLRSFPSISEKHPGKHAWPIAQSKWDIRCVHIERTDQLTNTHTHTCQRVHNEQTQMWAGSCSRGFSRFKTHINVNYKLDNDGGTVVPRERNWSD